MSNHTKYLTIALVVAIGVANGFYSFNPSLVELKEKREGTYISKTLEPQRPAGQQQQSRSSKDEKPE
ncbi:hypothetical protein QBC35DRAFT_449476 [Podospora australis]|uniref:Uncharacterized protein n=1 Tax=Podospora australis TaxID=1536484 RepID=A0AAN7ALB2_9PEZI|nr:hypothetical protein QBC35DRAFT_449476 [Podospora australis]